MATAEPEAPTTEQQPAPAVEEEEKKPQEEETVVKEKKEKAPLKKKTKEGKTASHPPYFQMIKGAIMAQNERNGSSPYAIAKYMEEKHKAELPANFRKIMALQLKNSAAKGKLIKVKASYKLSGAAKMEKKTSPPVALRKTRAAAKTKAAKKPATEKKKRKMKKVPTGKPAEASASKKVGTKRTRKAAAAAAKPKQPKSIKSPAVRKTKRARVSAI